ncbi:DMT family transporter [Sphingomonas bacterium]|uniref:DMT family transporter n=1 Tax=Sphingomonas bacterium TaxID=1895847 RepID=UPI001576963C|nr:DMT family transporter [Sphingomonas bacterium]
MQRQGTAILIPFAVVTLIWGSTWLVIRDQIAVVPGLWSVAYRFALAGAAMGLLALARRERFPADAAGLGFAGALGVTQFTLNYTFVYAAEAHIASGLVAVVFALLLLPNALLGRLVLAQRLSARLLVGSGVAMAGVALLIVQQARADPSGPHETLVGVVLTIGAILAASCANVAQGTAVARRYPMTATLALAMLAGAAVDAGLAMTVAGPPPFPASWRYWAGVAWLALAGSALAFSLYYRVLRVIGTARAAYAGVLVPVIAMLLSTLFEGYRWSALAVTGAVLTGIGLLVALSARRPAR